MSATPRARLAGAFAFAGACGIALLAAFGDRPRLWALPLALLGVVGACCGVSGAVALLVSPAPYALRVRHLAAGATAAWVALELAGGAQRLGLRDTSSAFRVFWAPCSEELCKALLLAAVWSPSDEQRSRTEIVTAALTVGVGFAAHENFVYFNVALEQPLFLEWIVLRAVPPVLAHAAFGMIMGGMIAQRALRSRVLGHAAPRISITGTAAAIIAHALYNGGALLAGRHGGAWTVPLVAAWSLSALLGAVLLRRRVLREAALDEAIVTTMAPTSERFHTPVAVVLAVVTVLWLVPIDASRYVALLFTPIALGLAATHGLALALGARRTLGAVVLGASLRPLVRVPEAMIVVLGRALRGSRLSLPLSVLGHAAWVGAVVLAVWLFARHRGRRGATVFAAGVSAGLIGTTIGTRLASLRGVSLGRVLLTEITGALPLTIALGALAGRLAQGSGVRALAATVGVASLAAGVGELLRKIRPGPFAAGALVSLASAALLVAVVAEMQRRSAHERDGIAPEAATSSSHDRGAAPPTL